MCQLFECCYRADVGIQSQLLTHLQQALLRTYLCIWVVVFIYSRVLDSFGVKYYPIFTWLIDVNIELGERYIPDEETPVEIPDPEEEKRIKDFLDGIMDDLSGRGFGKGL